MTTTTARDLLARVQGQFGTILADPPWRFQNRTGKVAPEHQRLLRYPTLDFDEIYQLPVSALAAEKSHLYLWVPNALLAEGLETMRQWGFTYKTNIVWYKISQRRRSRWKGRWLLFSQRYRSSVVWCAWFHAYSSSR